MFGLYDPEPSFAPDRILAASNTDLPIYFGEGSEENPFSADYRATGEKLITPMFLAHSTTNTRCLQKPVDAFLFYRSTEFAIGSFISCEEPIPNG
jgi:hypothetical protein